MSTEQKSLEVKVGMFVFAGLVAIAIMAVQFGRVGQGLEKTYDLQVEFANASGLLKNSDVQLAGAAIGYVVEKPQITPGKVGSVTVQLRIKDSVKIPRDSNFQVGSSGLMGDKSVAITPPVDFKPEKFNPLDHRQTYQAGETVLGSEPGGIEALTKKSEEMMGKLSENLDEMKTMLVKIQSGVLSDENMENLRSGFASIKTTGDNFAKASEQLDTIMVEAKDAVAGAKTTMGTANAAAEDIRSVIAEAQNTLKGAQGAIKTVQGVLNNAQSGNGAVPMLLSNREVADNLRALIANIRKHGMLFYRDSAGAEQQRASSPGTTTRSSRASNR